MALALASGARSLGAWHVTSIRAGAGPKSHWLGGLSGPREWASPSPLAPTAHGCCSGCPGCQGVSHYFSAGKKSVPAKTPQKQIFRSGSAWKCGTLERRRSEGVGIFNRAEEGMGTGRQELLGSA